MRGLKLECASIEAAASRRAARSASLMRGLKRKGISRAKGVRPEGRAVCPANEGIETRQSRAAWIPAFPRRAVCPANEEIETAIQAVRGAHDL